VEATNSFRGDGTTRLFFEALNANMVAATQSELVEPFIASWCS